jgi:hypothetical protein
MSQYIVIHRLEYVSFLIFSLSVGTNSSKTEKSGMICCRRQNPCRVVVSEEDEEEE